MAVIDSSDESAMSFINNFTEITDNCILIQSLLMFKYFKSNQNFTIIFELLLKTGFQGVILQGRTDGSCVTFEPWFLPRFLPRP